MEPIELDKCEIAWVHMPFSGEPDLKVPAGPGWWLHCALPESRPTVGGVWMLYRREKQSAPPAPLEPDLHPGHTLEGSS
jgi:hypothetical protein